MTSAWKIELSTDISKQLRKIDRKNSERIIDYLEQRVAGTNDPRRLGRALKGKEFENLWRYRIGDYRVICDLQDNRLVVLVIEIGHRREIYR